MRISDWSSDVCSSDLRWGRAAAIRRGAVSLSRRLRRHPIPEDADLPDRIVPTSSHDRCRPVGEAEAGQGERADFQDKRIKYKTLRLIINNAGKKTAHIFPEPNRMGRGDGQRNGKEGGVVPSAPARNGPRVR